ncbi:MAG: histidine phosphatase family protein [bacterium]|nr:histidine phosphatase family protein [bacterium]
MQLLALRHARALAGPDDILRPLGALGVEQARKRRQTLGAPTFDIIAASPAVRTVSTAALVSETLESSVIKFDALYSDTTSEQGKVLDALFEKLLYAPCSAYYAQQGGEVVREHGIAAWAVVYNLLIHVHIRSMLVVGHAVLIQAMGQAICAGKTEMVERLGELNLGECEGYELTLNDDTEVTELKIIR